MTDILLIIWKIFAGVVLVSAIIFIVVTIIIKFFEFWKGNEGDDYKR